MQRSIVIIAAVVGGLLFLLMQTVYIVDQTQQALVLRVGQIQRYANVGTTGTPGLYVKMPFIESTVVFDKRNLGFTLTEQPIIASDQENLIVDAFVRWRIVDPLRFYQAANTQSAGVDRLETFTQSALRRVLGGATSNDIILRRGPLMRAIREDLNREAATELGVAVIDVRIRQADLPQQTQQRVFERMRTEREQVAAGIRARGEEQATRIRAGADREVTVVQATAREQSEAIRGRGDAERARIFARSYGRNPEFASFYRSLIAYERAIKAGTPVVIPPDSDFFRYMRNRHGTGR
ncbi:MAG: protease modulator HflC [Caulobacterales bacterium]